MVHNRECPKCGKIVSWTKGKKTQETMPNGETVGVYHPKLFCPEHGLFEPRAHAQLNKALNRVMKEIEK